MFLFGELLALLTKLNLVLLHRRLRLVEVDLDVPAVLRVCHRVRLGLAVVRFVDVQSLQSFDLFQQGVSQSHCLDRSPGVAVLVLEASLAFLLGGLAQLTRRIFLLRAYDAVHPTQSLEADVLLALALVFFVVDVERVCYFAPRITDVRITLVRVVVERHHRGGECLRTRGVVIQLDLHPPYCRCVDATEKTNGCPRLVGEFVDLHNVLYLGAAITTFPGRDIVQVATACLRHWYSLLC
ncbi:hypothetical protein D3C86_1509970 [compost metagenome]